MTQDDDERVPRAFYFSLVVWGDAFRNFFLEFALPSLLSAGNIPSLVGRRPVKFLIATTAEDWAQICVSPIFQELERYAVPILVELSQDSRNSPHWMRAYQGQLRCCEIVAQDHAYRVFVGPDAIYSDGMVARLHELAMAGVQAVLKLVTPQVDQDLFFNELRRRNLLPKVSARESGRPLSYPPRQLVSVSLRSMHSMLVVNEWDAPYFCGYAAAPWWRVPGEDGIVSFGMQWDLILADYESVLSYDPATQYERGLDGDYNLRNVGHLKTIYAVRDSDEMFIVSWALTSYGACSLETRFKSDLGRAIPFRRSFYHPSFNRLHRQCLFIPTRIHAEPLNDNWNRVESRALRTFLTWLDPPQHLADLGRGLPITHAQLADIEAQIAAGGLPWWRRNERIWAAYLWLGSLTIVFDIRRQIGRLSRPRALISRLMVRTPRLRAIVRRMVLAFSGDPATLRWVGWRLRKLAADLRRRPFDEQRPDVLN
jgi:hypothetical protein